MIPSKIASALKILINIRQPVFLWGPPGVGKSQLVAKTAQDLGLELVDIRAVLLDPVDLRGLPRITSDGRAEWCAPAFLPQEKSETKGLLFLDELNSAPPLVQAACYQLILDRRVGEYLLPDGWTVIAAGNRESDRAVTHRMPTALANRMVHLECSVDLADWLAWANENHIRPEVKAFLRYRPKLLFDFDPTLKTKAFASPRSWEFLSRVMDQDPEPEVADELYRGCVGEGAGTEFLGFLQIMQHLPAVSEILDNPLEAVVPKEPAALYALCEALAFYAKDSTLNALATYAHRLPAEFGVLLLSGCICQDKTLVNHPSFTAWAESHAAVLI
ncbi:MAG: AAA family ATPase [Desulfovibrionaceae bacterium]|nr:AAA family ATPase [Desulfovibrionaceae bacterium]